MLDRSSFSHVALFLETNDLLNLYAHVNFQKVHVNTQPYFERKYKVIKSLEYEINDADYDYITKEIARFEGADYGFLTLIGIGIARILRLFKIRAKNIFRDRNKTFFCSEFIWYLLTLCSFHIDDFDPELDGPKKLYQILSCDFTEG
jgi:hypothetical protein